MPIERECIKYKPERNDDFAKDVFDAMRYVNAIPFVTPFKNDAVVKYVSIVVTDVNVIVPNKVVQVTFADGGKEKAVCQYPDVFDLETAIGLCIAKHAIGGQSEYHKLVRDGIKTYENKLKKEKEENELQERIARKRAKRIAYKKRKEERKREEAINIQKEAYVRAMQEINNTNK